MMMRSSNDDDNHGPTDQTNSYDYYNESDFDEEDDWEPIHVSMDAISVNNIFQQPDDEPISLRSAILRRQKNTNTARVAPSSSVSALSPTQAQWPRPDSPNRFNPHHQQQPASHASVWTSLQQQQQHLGDPSFLGMTNASIQLPNNHHNDYFNEDDEDCWIEHDGNTTTTTTNNNDDDPNNQQTNTNGAQHKNDDPNQTAGRVPDNDKDDNNDDDDDNRSFLPPPTSSSLSSSTHLVVARNLLGVLEEKSHDTTARMLLQEKQNDPRIPNSQQIKPNHSNSNDEDDSLEWEACHLEPEPAAIRKDNDDDNLGDSRRQQEQGYNDDDQQEHRTTTATAARTTTLTLAAAASPSQQQQQRQEAARPHEHESRSAPTNDHDEPLSRELAMPAMVMEDESKIVVPGSSNNNNSAMVQQQQQQQQQQRKRRLEQELMEEPWNVFWQRFFTHLGQEVLFSWNRAKVIHLLPHIALALVVTGTVVECLYFGFWIIASQQPIALVGFCLAAIISLVVVAHEVLFSDDEGWANHKTKMEQIPHAMLDAIMQAVQRRLTEKEHASFRQAVWLSAMLIPTWFQIHALLFLVQVILFHGTNKAGWVAVALVIMASASCSWYQIHRQSAAAETNRSLLVSPNWVFVYVSAWFVACLPLSQQSSSPEEDGVMTDANSNSSSSSAPFQHFQLDFPWSLAHFAVATGVVLWVFYKDECSRGHNNNDGQAFHRVVLECIKKATDDVRALISEKIRASRCTKDNELEVALMRWVLVDSWRPTESSQTSASSEDIHQHVDSRQSENETWSSTSKPQETTHGVPEHLPAPFRNDSESRDSKGAVNFWRSLCDTNLNETAQPAVTAYKDAIESIPPKRDISMVVAVLAQCPAILACLQVVSWECTTLASESWKLENPILSILFLLPFVALDFVTIQQWIVSCHELTTYRRGYGYAAGETNLQGTDESMDYSLAIATFWEDEIDCMILLFSPSNRRVPNADGNFYPPALLRVWWNIVDSLASLEKAMTTARCVQTTAVAVDLANNLQSLVDFGVQVQERGWLHGLGLLLQEVIVSMDESMISNYNVGARGVEQRPRTRYIDAASTTVRNTQIMYQNLDALRN